MNSRVFIFIFLSIFFLASCASSGKSENVVDGNNTDATNANKTTSASQELKENECKICDFDFASYKGELEKKEVDGLLLALNDEYMAMAIYQEVNKKFGDPRPFSNIVRAEETHAQRLIGLFDTYKIPVPKNPWPGNVPVFESVQSACEAGVKAEVINGDLYSKLFESTTRADITAAYKALQRASEENHKPAFERCAAGQGGGKGFGRGNGRAN